MPTSMHWKPLVAATLLCFAAAARGMDVVETPKLVWSDEKTSTTPEGALKLHGEFSNENITASLENLPPHDFLQITCQLLILRSWDGLARHNGGNRMGPDYFRLGLEDGRTLVHASFSNTPVLSGFNPEGNFQSYPSPVPGDRVPYMTGSDFKNNFGYYFPSQGPPLPVHQDALYTLTMTVPHAADKVTLNFHGMGLQDIGDESWGVTAVRIIPRTRTQVGNPRIGDKDYYETSVDGDGHETRTLVMSSFQRLLDTAAGSDPIAASAAFWRLVTAGDATTAYLVKNLKPIPVQADKIKALAEAVYQDAAPADETDPRIKELLKFGTTAEPVLRSLRMDRKENPSRLDWALMEIGMIRIEDPELRRWVVATRILEAIGTQEAKNARGTLAGLPK